MKPLIIIIELLLLAAECMGAERGKPFVPPKQVPELRLVVDTAPVGSAAACPMDASVLVQVMDEASVFGGSGTCVQSENGESLILTCAHTWRGCKSPDIRVIWGKRDLVATKVKEDTDADLALLKVDAEIPAVELADELPKLNDTLTSVGASINWQNLVEQEHKFLRHETNGKPPFLITAGTMQWSGRSGGGLFHNGKLVGTVIGLRNDARVSMYSTLDQCRAMLNQPVGSSPKFAVTLWKAPFRCIPCDRSEKNLVGDERFDLTVKTGPAPFMDAGWRERNKLRGYPYFEHNGKIYYGYTTADGLAKLLESEQSPAEAPGPVGATIHGAAAIESTLVQLKSWFGENASFSFRWTRNDALEALPMGKTPTREELLGKSGRIELTARQSSLPIREIAFDYRFSNGKVYFMFDEIECEIPEENAVGAAPVGSPFLIAWSVLSTIQTIHDLLHPTVSVFLGKELSATATLADGKLSVDLGPNPPAVKANWRLWWGLLRWEISRPLQSVDISPKEIGVHFKNVRFYKDIVIDVVE